MNPFPVSPPAAVLFEEIQAARIPRRSTDPILLAVLSSALLSGCGAINLRKAMTGVEERYVRLTQMLESGSNFGARDAALALRKALESPPVARESPYAADPEYQQLLREAVESAERVRTVAKRFDSSALEGMRTEVSARCDACHKKFRRP